MRKSNFVALIAMLAALAALSLVAGCGGGQGTGGATGLQLFLADDPLDAKAVNVTISRVDVSKDGNGWTTVRDFTSSPVTINLLDYRYDGNAATPDNYLLADSPLEAGHYTQIRLILTKVEIVDKSDTTHECLMSSEDKTGLKLVGEFDVSSGAKSAVLIDFDAAKSIVSEGNGVYRLKPTTRVVALQVSGTVHGKVEFQGADNTSVAVPVGATITAYQGETSVASALVNESDGTFGISGLVAGDYTLKLETPGYSAPDTNVSVTAQGDTDAGTITATATP